MDDPVVLAAVEQLLDLDFVVGTFNFRLVCVLSVLFPSRFVLGTIC